MEKHLVSRIPLPVHWEPEKVAESILSEVEKNWEEGWVYVRAETDALMESVCLFFSRPTS